MAQADEIICDVCGNPATRGERDLKEIFPIYTPPGTYKEKWLPTDGSWWRAWDPIGTGRFGCKEHPPEQSRAFYMDRQEIEDYILANTPKV